MFWVRGVSMVFFLSVGLPLDLCIAVEGVGSWGDCHACTFGLRDEHVEETTRRAMPPASLAMSLTGSVIEG